jgi:thioredoxin reductase
MVQRSRLPCMLGCECDDNGLIRTKGKQGTGVCGLFLAGDADGDVQFAIVAAAEGAVAATAINRELQDEDMGEADPVAVDSRTPQAAVCIKP